jgi:hypothetical protein
MVSAYIDQTPGEIAQFEPGPSFLREQPGINACLVAQFNRSVETFGVEEFSAVWCRG